MERSNDMLIRALLRGEALDQALPLARVLPLDSRGHGENPPLTDDGSRESATSDDADDFDWSRLTGPPHADFQWCDALLVEYQARWPDHDREIGRRCLGSLALSEDEGRQLIDRVAHVVRAHAPLTIARFRRLTGSRPVWNAWAAMFTLAVAEFAYRWVPDEDTDRRFWEACLRRFGDSKPDDVNHHNAARRLLDDGFEIWSLRRAAADAYQYVTTVMLQSGVPRYYLPAFRNLLDAVREEYGWDRLARESPPDVAGHVCTIGRERWPTSGLRHLFGGERGWESPNEAAGEMIRGLARLARFCEQTGKDVRALTDNEVRDAIQADAGVIAHFRDWRHVAEVLHRSTARAAHRSAPWLAWSPVEGIVCVFPGQQVEVEAGDAAALTLRVGDATLARVPLATGAPSARGPLYLSDAQVRLAHVDGAIVWDLVDGFDRAVCSWRVPRIGERGCAFLVLDPRRETLLIEPQRVRDLPHAVLLAPRAHLDAARWPAGTEVAPFDGVVGIDDWAGVRATRHLDEVCVSLGDRRFVWYASATEPRLCGLRTSPSDLGATTRFLAAPLLWLPVHLAHTTVVVDGQQLAPDAAREVYDDGSVSIALTGTEGRVTVEAADRTVALCWQVDVPPPVPPPGHPRWTLIVNGRKHDHLLGAWEGDVRELVGTDLHVDGLWPGDVFAVVVCDGDGRRQGQVQVVADRHGRAQVGLIALAEALRPGLAPRPQAIAVEGISWGKTYVVAQVQPVARVPDQSELPVTPVADGYAPPGLIPLVVDLASAWSVDGHPLAVRRGTLAVAVEDIFPPPLTPSEDEALAAIDIALERGELSAVPDGYVAASRPCLFVESSGADFATGHRALGRWLAERRLGVGYDGQSADQPAFVRGPVSPDLSSLLTDWGRVVAIPELIHSLPRLQWPRDPGRAVDEPFPVAGWECLEVTAAHPVWRRVGPDTRRPLAGSLRKREGNRFVYRWWEHEAMWAPDPAALSCIRWLIQTLSGHVRVVAVPADLTPPLPGWYHLGCPSWPPREHFQLVRRLSYPALDRGRLVAPRQLDTIRRIFASLHATIEGLPEEP